MSLQLIVLTLKAVLCYKTLSWNVLNDYVEVGRDEVRVG
jgi:hypothetical protein